jgi:hypothetical protein
LNERQRRLWAASEARSCGPGGIAAVVRATGISKNTVQRGIAELRERGHGWRRVVSVGGVRGGRG